MAGGGDGNVSANWDMNRSNKKPEFVIQQFTADSEILASN